MIVVVDRHAPSQMIAIALSEAKNVGQPMLRDVQTAAGKVRLQQHAPLAFFDADIRNFRRPIHIEFRFPMGERNVNRIVFQIVDVVARADISFRPEIVFLEIRITRQRRRLAFAEIDEDQSEVFLSRTTANANLLGEGFFLRRLLDALSGADRTSNRESGSECNRPRPSRPKVAFGGAGSESRRRAACRRRRDRA